MGYTQERHDRYGKIEGRTRRALYVLFMLSVDVKKKMTFTAPVDRKKYLSLTLHLQIHLCLHFSPWFLNYTDDQGLWKLAVHREEPEFSYAPKHGPDSTDNLLKHVQLSTKNLGELHNSLKPSLCLLTVAETPQLPADACWAEWL